MALSKLSDDEQRVIFSTLSNPLRPVIAINFCSASKELWVLTQGLRHQLKADNNVAAVFALKLGRVGRAQGYSDQYACSLLRNQKYINICSEGYVVCNETEMELLGRLGSFLQKLVHLSLRQVPLGLPSADNRFLHFAKSLCAGALSKLTQLCICNTFIGEDGIVALAAAVDLGAMPRLWSIRMTSAGINDAALKALVPALRKMKNLGEIGLRDNTFGDKGLAAFLPLFPFEGVWPRLYPPGGRPIPRACEGVELEIHMLEEVDISDNNVNITQHLALARVTQHPLLVDGERVKTRVTIDRGHYYS